MTVHMAGNPPSACTPLVTVERRGRERGLEAAPPPVPAARSPANGADWGIAGLPMVICSFGLDADGSFPGEMPDSIVHNRDQIAQTQRMVRLSALRAREKLRKLSDNPMVAFHQLKFGQIGHNAVRERPRA